MKSNLPDIARETSPEKGKADLVNSYLKTARRDSPAARAAYHRHPEGPWPFCVGEHPVPTGYTFVECELSEWMNWVDSNASPILICNS